MIPVNEWLHNQWSADVDTDIMYLKVHKFLPDGSKIGAKCKVSQDVLLVKGTDVVYEALKLKAIPYGEAEETPLVTLEEEDLR